MLGVDERGFARSESDLSEIDAVHLVQLDWQRSLNQSRWLTTYLLKVI
jgi:hypothetical protein